MEGEAALVFVVLNSSLLRHVTPRPVSDVGRRAAHGLVFDVWTEYPSGLRFQLGSRKPCISDLGSRCPESMTFYQARTR